MHAIHAAIAGQGVALINLTLAVDELRGGLLCQPFEIELPGHCFHVVWSEGYDADPDITAVRTWLLDEVKIR